MHRHAESYRNNVHTTNDEMSSWGWASQRDTSDDDVTFLEILHQILDESEDCPNHIISWRNDGLSFQIHDFRRFEHYLLPVYFGDGSAYCTSNQKHEALKNYDAFLGRLQSYCFHRISIDGFRKDICRHPLFVRGKRHLALKMISHKTSFLIVPRRDSWPMPALSNSGKKPSEFQRAKESRRPRPIRASIFQLKQKLAKRKSFMRQRLISSSFSTTDRRLSFKETLLRRKRSNCGSDYLPQRLNKSQTSLDELLRDFSFLPTNSKTTAMSTSRSLCRRDVMSHSFPATVPISTTTSVLATTLMWSHWTQFVTTMTHPSTESLQQPSPIYDTGRWTLRIPNKFCT